MSRPLRARLLAVRDEPEIELAHDVRMQRFVLGERQLAGAQLVVGNRQRILVGVIAGLILEEFRRGVSLSAGAGRGCRPHIRRDRPR